MYSPKDVVRIEREISSKAKDIQILNDKIEELDVLISSKQKKLSSLETENISLLKTMKRQRDGFLMSLIQDIGANSKENEKLRTENAVLEESIKSLKNTYSVYLKELSNLSKKANNNTLLQSLEKQLSEKLSSLSSEISKKETCLKGLIKKEDNESKKIDDLKKEETLLESRIKELEKEKTEDLKSITKLKIEKDELDSKIKKIEKREQATKIMLKRVSKEYLKHYKSLPYKQNLKK